MARRLSAADAERYRDVMLESDEAALDGLDAALRRLAAGFAGAADEDERAPWRDAIVDEVYGRVAEAAAEKQAQADEWCEAVAGKRPAPHSSPSLEKAEARVRSAANALFAHDDTDQFVASLVTFARNEIHEATIAAVADNCET